MTQEASFLEEWKEIFQSINSLGGLDDVVFIGMYIYIEHANVI